MSVTRLASSTAPHARRSSLGAAAVAAVSVFAAGGVGQIATVPRLFGWYPSLAKPWFTPPDPVFGGAWGFLYLLMAFAFWRILRMPAGTPGRRTAILVFSAQLVMNALWPVIFFGFKTPFGGLVEIVPQWLLVVATIAAFWPLDRLAALALCPLAAWLAFAGLLNFEIWRLN